MNAEIDISNVVLTTDRLKLRFWQLSDLNDLYTYASVDGVGQMAGWQPHKDKLHSLDILLYFIEQRNSFALEQNGKVIGSLGIEKYSEDKFPEFEDKRCREIGYALSKDYWGQGLMPEAVNKVKEYLFEEENLDVIFCRHSLHNLQSARVQEKCGFHHYAVRKYETGLGTVEEKEVNIITREEYVK